MCAGEDKRENIISISKPISIIKTKPYVNDFVFRKHAEAHYSLNNEYIVSGQTFNYFLEGLSNSYSMFNK